MEPIKVLIVDDVAGTREDIRRLLFFEEDIKVVGEADDGSVAIASAEDLRPDVILMDINLPEMDGITATEEITNKVPESAVIIVSIQGEQEYIRKAMAAGAGDYLVKPINSSELAAAIRRVHEKHKHRQNLLGIQAQAGSRRQGKIITVFSTRGGVGRTLVAVNLAAALAQEGRKTVLVDLVLGEGDIEVALNLKARRTLADLVDEAATEDLVMVDNFLIAHYTGTKVLCGPSRDDAYLVTPEALQHALDLLTERYSYVILDTGVRPDSLTQAALSASDLILLLATPELLSIRHARSALDFLTDHSLRDRAAIVLNRAGLEGGIKTPEIERVLECKCLASLPEDGKAAVTSLNKGQSILTTSPAGKLTQAIRTLARRLCSPEEKDTEETPRLSIAARLFSL